jgi:hypothetical protein
MAYHEVALSERPKQTLIIKPGDTGTTFDLDYFGHDDGAARDKNFRLIFQLGSGFMIYLYVVGFPLDEPLKYFHTFWIKDCAVAEVEMEELGAPEFVSCHLRPLPVVYKHLSLTDAQENTRKFVVDSCAFEARAEPLFLQMRWALYSLSDGKLAALLWNNKDGFLLERNGKTRKLLEGERFIFSS